MQTRLVQRNGQSRSVLFLSCLCLFPGLASLCSCMSAWCWSLAVLALLCNVHVRCIFLFVSLSAHLLVWSATQLCSFFSCWSSTACVSVVFCFKLFCHARYRQLCYSHQLEFAHTSSPLCVSSFSAPCVRLHHHICFLVFSCLPCLRVSEVY